MNIIWKFKTILLILLFIIFGIGTFSFGQAPEFHESMGDDISDSTYNFNIDRDKSLRDNVRELFVPTDWWQIWTAIRVIWVGVFFLFLIWSGIQFLLWASDETKVKEAQKSLLYIWYWIVLFFGVTWILWDVLQLSTTSVSWTEDIVEGVGDNILFQALTFLKAAAFFAAIIMIFYYWYRIIQAFEKEDKITEARKWVINVLIALVFIKVIDFLYYIAQQQDFRSQAWELLIWFAQILGYILWAWLLIAIFYAWFLMLTSRWEEEQFNKWKNLIKSVFIVGLIIMLFLLIIYQIINELW